jgi:hypothetical protein
MEWLRRAGRASEPGTGEPADSLPTPVEQSTPGISAFFDGIGEDGTHAVLDLGPSSDASFRVFSRFARRIRFADLLTAAGAKADWAAALKAIPAQPERPYDLIFAWDILDRIGPQERQSLVAHLAEISNRRARLYVLVESSEKQVVRPRRFALLDVDRLRYESVGPEQLARTWLKPAEVERLLAPFQVMRAFTLKVGLREYVAQRNA